MQCNFNKPQALAIIKGGPTAPRVIGTVKFYQKKTCVLVVADIKNLPYTDTGFFGFHIHEGTDCGGVGFMDSKSHYNPFVTSHPKHAGDLPPLILCGNRAHSSVLTDRFNVADIIGRTVIIHNMPDDFTTQPSGNAGEKIACGIIKKP
ncbi:MAG: superoxide dismutase family protein [Clostridia bacterium]|nr:superoxide dismutase family protein [Clostridia bacterium]